MSDTIELPACRTEDSTNCWWDATVHGNGEGHSFVNYEQTWQVLEFPEGNHLTGVTVTIHEDDGGYTPDIFHTFEWFTAPNTTTTTVVTTPSESALPQTGAPEADPILAFAMLAAVAGGALYAWSRKSPFARGGE